MKIITYLLAVLLLISPALAEDWSMFKKDSQHTGFTTDTVNPPLTLKWVSNLRFDTDSSPIIVNGVLYVGSDYGVHAIDAATGNEIWRTQTNGFINSVPVVADGTLYIGGDDNRFYSIDITNGTIKWIYKNATDGFLSSAVVIGNLVYVGSKDGALYAFNVNTGEPSWTALSGKNIDSSPAFSDGTIYVGNDNGIIFAYDAAGGKEKWRYYTNTGEIKSSPAVANGILFVGSNNGNIYALTADKGDLKWKYSTGNNVESSPSVKDGTVFVGSKDFNLYAIDVATGTKKWSFGAAGYVDSSPAIANDVVYFGSKNNLMYAVDANTGSLLWKNSTGTKDKDYITSPAVSGNMLYAVTHSGFVYAYSSEELVQKTPAATVTATPSTTVTATVEKTTGIPTPSPSPVATQKTPGFEYAVLILIIVFLIRKRY